MTSLSNRLSTSAATRASRTPFLWPIRIRSPRSWRPSKAICSTKPRTQTDSPVLEVIEYDDSVSDCLNEGSIFFLQVIIQNYFIVDTRRSSTVQIWTWTWLVCVCQISLIAFHWAAIKAGKTKYTACIQDAKMFFLDVLLGMTWLAIDSRWVLSTREGIIPDFSVIVHLRETEYNRERI